MFEIFLGGGGCHLKKNGGPNLGPTGLNHAQIMPKMSFFSIFLSLDHTMFNIYLEQCLTSSRSKTHKKKLGRTDQNQAQN